MRPDSTREDLPLDVIERLVASSTFCIGTIPMPRNLSGRDDHLTM